ISASSATAVSVTPASGTLGSGSVVSASVASVPAGVSLQITIRNTTTGTGRRDIDYWVISPSNQTVCSGRVARNSSRTCTVARTTAGQYRVELQRANNDSMTYSLSAERYTTNDCSGSRSNGDWGWVNCVSQTPLLPNGQRRSVEEEKRNFATWFSYHRTRMKAAKAGASEAFSALDSRVRV